MSTTEAGCSTRCRRTSMKPGDLIEWVYKSDSQPVDEDAELWSTPMQRWVPIGVRPAILVSITDEFYSWLTPGGCSARVWITRRSY